jgi:hypothetical protein
MVQPYNEFETGYKEGEKIELNRLKRGDKQAK